MRDYEKIRSAIIRGGTSKGVFILKNDLPADPETRDKVILSIYGGTDERQIDGLGGADSLTSKLAIVSVSARPDADIDFTFGQVGIGTGKIDYHSNCGNILSGVGPFAIDEGLVPVQTPCTKVRIFNTNTNTIIEAAVPVEAGKSISTGDYTIDGVPGKGAKIILDFKNASGAKTGRLFPTRQRKETLITDAGNFDVSIVDLAAPVVFVQANQLGLTGTELSAQLTEKHLWTLENIRSHAAQKIGFVANTEDATKVTPSSPKIIMVSPSQTYSTMHGETVDATSVHLTARAMSMQKMHKTFPVTGGLCTAAAARLQGTVVHDCSAYPGRDEIIIGHPSGSMEFSISCKDTDNDVQFEKTAVARTSRRLMEGYSYVPKELYWNGIESAFGV
ncbi:2-methylaconitate cis-trans isomerase PrpF family protein [Oceanobacillus sp. CFH 90083]|uniref:2-methylaconitate cis-trans isomerase PrpF family protein n=1 Tax=Oceanobacillus sp. CFH 90083 TaxID=2592336 RepID=UPI00128D6D58|nr:PrpF domain-containing protein [Oceanobacillus sp. CFH 90083]